MAEAPLKILIVDDEPVNIILFTKMISTYGHRPLKAKDGLEAVVQFELEEPDLVLMDLMMPVMDGYEATRRIKALAGDRFVPVIVLTAMSDPVSLSRSVEAGADDFLIKPFSTTILKAKLDAQVRTRHLFQTIAAQKTELKTYLDQLIMEQEIAREVYNKMLTKSFRDFAHIDSWSCASSLFNGDILVTARDPQGNANILLGDFTGHGLSAAIGALPAADLFYDLSIAGQDCKTIAFELNRKLVAMLPPFMFMSATLVFHDVANNRLTACNCGLPDGLVRGAAGIRQRLKSRNLPIGITPGRKFDPIMETIELAHNEELIIYSDGLVEALGPDGTRFGRTRLEACLTANTGRNPLKAVITELRRFQDGESSPDDITIARVGYAA